MYNPLTDFMALIRIVSGVASVERMPGLDFVLAAMARANMFTLWTGQTAPTVNQTTTVWLKPSSPSWVAEGVVYLWDANTSTYVLATPDLWDAVLNSFGVFQSTAVNSAVIGANTSLFAVQRAAPTSTILALPTVGSRQGRELKIVDYSIGVVGHAITLTPAAGNTIMQLPQFTLFSTADQLAGITLHPSTDLNAWVIAP